MAKFVPTNDDCIKVDKMLSDNGVWAEDVSLVKEPYGVVMCVSIHWGDWKHDHLRTDYLVKEMFPDVLDIGVDVTEENGSDCYCGIHRYLFLDLNV